MIKHHKQGYINKDQTLCMSTFLLHQTVIEQIDKFRKFLWRDIIKLLDKKQRKGKGAT